MKIKTVLLIVSMAVLFGLVHLFLREADNRALLAAEFVVFGFRMSVARVMVAAMIGAALLPSLYFSYKAFRLYGFASEGESSGHAQDAHGARLSQISGLVAHGAYQAALDLAGETSDPVVRYWKARAYSGLKDYQAVLHMSAEATTPEHRYLAAEARKELGMDREPLLREMIAQDPQHAERAYRWLAADLDAQQKPRECLALLQQAVRHGVPVADKDLVAYRYQVAVCGDEPSPKRRIEQVQKILKDAPDFVPANLGLGDLYMETGAVEKAFRVYEQAFDRTDNIVFLERMEQYYLEQGRPEDVLAIYRQLLVQRGGSTIKLQLGRLYFTLGMYEAAADILTPLKPRLGHLSEFIWMLACLAREDGRHQEAAALLKDLVERDGHASDRYACNSCGAGSRAWAPRCDVCGSWGDMHQYGEKREQEVVRATAPVY